MNKEYAEYRIKKLTSFFKGVEVTDLKPHWAENKEQRYVQTDLFCFTVSVGTDGCKFTVYSEPFNAYQSNKEQLNVIIYKALEKANKSMFDHLVLNIKD